MDHGSMSMTKVKDHKTLQGAQSSQTSIMGSKPLEGKRELAPSILSRSPSWLEMTLMDAHEQVKAPRSSMREQSFQTSWH